MLLVVKQVLLVVGSHVECAPVINPGFGNSGESEVEGMFLNDTGGNPP
jgi:hypothetical protein